MNTKGNQRYHETENRIKGVFLTLLTESEPEQITVSEICAKAKIHRTTFYGHYEDINALMNQLVKEMYQQVTGFFVPEHSIEEEPVHAESHANGFQKLFEMVQEQRGFFLYYFKYASYSEKEEKMLPELLFRQMNEMIHNRGYESEEELLYHQIFFSRGLMAVMDRWLRSGCRESPEQMCKIVAKMSFSK